MEYCGTNYKGSRVNGRMEGTGIYLFSSGTRYEGEMKDGMFHGEGTLYLPTGSAFVAHWNNGHPNKGKIIFSDGLEYCADSHYCDEYDRRFYSEITNGLKPAGRSQMVDKEPARKIPPGCYDTGDGFCHSIKRIVYSYDGKFLRNADNDEHAWIETKCRKAWDQHVGAKFDPKFDGESQKPY